VGFLANEMDECIERMFDLTVRGKIVEHHANKPLQVKNAAQEHLTCTFFGFQACRILFLNIFDRI
jgi:hypothetical protein